MSSVDAPQDTLDNGSGGLQSPTPGQLVYEYTPQVTAIVEYGTSAEAMFAGGTPPPEGARLDLYLEGPVSGGKLDGRVRGVDYLNFRADGRAELHIHAEITTDKGPKVALEAGGVATRRGDSSIFELREHVSLTSNHPDLSWVNAIEVWARGVVDVSSGQVRLRAFVL